jgi:thiamine-monophosphate kinase
VTDEDELVPRLLAAVRAAGGATTGQGVLVGPGDEKAVLRPAPDEDLVWTVDDHVEGVHFRAAWGLAAGGRKAAVAALSDLAGLGARPLGALLALHVPRGRRGVEAGGVDEAALLELCRGVGEGLAACGCPLLGGNLTAHPERLALSTSALGAVPRGRALLRAGARPGDLVAVTGALGLARAGLAWLEGGGAPDDPRVREAVGALLAPRARLAEGRALAAAGQPACMDVSDGLRRDLPRLARASGVAVVVDVDALPGPSPSIAALVEPGRPPAEAAARLAWLGGEDYELLVAGPADLLAASGVALRTIGRVVAGPPGTVRLEGALAAAVGDAGSGFDHFA